MRSHPVVLVVVLLVGVLFVAGGCGTTERGGQPSGTSVSIGIGSNSTQTAPKVTTAVMRPSRTVPALPTATTQESAYTQEEIDYFLEIALGTEYGDSEQTIKKWTNDIRIEVLGTPTEEDLQTLEAVVEEINSLIGGVKMMVVEENPNVQMHFAPEDEFESIEPNYVPVNYGFFWSYWNASDELYKSTLLISTDEISQAERSHLIREEVTQVLGLMNDSNRYEESIFFEDWTETNNYSELDKSVIQMLYREGVEPGMTAREVVKVLEKAR